jgi:hypothetical protein
MLPDQNTEFLDIAQIAEYETQGYFCIAIVFSPETENNHFRGCPPYIGLSHQDTLQDVFFRVPNSVAYYGKTHAGYTMRGRDKAVEHGKHILQCELAQLLGLKKDD